MIGVIAGSVDHWAVREFFELFKTPWEFYQPGRRYDVVLCSDPAKLKSVDARLCLIFSGQKIAFDADQGIQIQSRLNGGELSAFGSSSPIYGEILTFQNTGSTHVSRSGETVIIRVGFDLFREVETLLVKGQPVRYAAVPTLEQHIDLIRNLISEYGIPFVEIPPVPDGSEFIVCLTHDLDHALIRNHKFDATMFGFLYRATVGSAINLGRGRMSASKVLKNWLAAAKLPFVHLGLAEDIWYQFDRYVDLEQGRPSTFFVIPFAASPGRSSRGSAPRNRATAYDISDIAPKIPRLRAAGKEIGLHGLDAWRDTDHAREEASRISEFAPKPELGVRMHWLYNNENSPAVLDAAGFSYDSTFGYNETVGYRAGTMQAYQPAGATRLLQLPMHVMDTALFYPSYLDFSEENAWEYLQPFFDNAVRFGGALTINWHDRSIAPERLWGDFYVRMLGELSRRGASFSTASQAVSWFRKRRSVVFERSGSDAKTLRATVQYQAGDGVPPLRLRFHNGSKSHTDVSFEGSVELDAHSLLPDRITVLNDLGGAING